MSTLETDRKRVLRFRPKRKLALKMELHFRPETFLSFSAENENRTM